MEVSFVSILRVVNECESLTACHRSVHLFKLFNNTHMACIARKA